MTSYFPQCVIIKSNRPGMHMKTSCNSLAPTASRPVSPPLTSASWHALPRGLLSPTCLANFYLSEIQIRHHLHRKEPSILPWCPRRLLQRLIPDGTVTVLPSTLRPQGQGQHLTCLCLPATLHSVWHMKKDLTVQNEDEFNLSVLLYTSPFDDNTTLIADSL